MAITNRWKAVALGLALVTTVAGCGGDKKSPTSPTGAAASGTAASGGSTESGTSATTNPDGSTLKATAPSALSPSGDVRVDSRTPVLQWTNSSGVYQTGTFTYLVELYKVNELVNTWEVPQASGAVTTSPVPAELDYNTIYRWRVRAKLGSAVGPWPVTANFSTPLPPGPVGVGGGGGGGGSYGPARTISFNEAFSMIVSYHNSSGVDLGRNSTREGRIAWLFEAVAIVHYGHARYNPQGGDRNWCVKDAGGGRPPSDDVIVRCDSREAWDLIGGAGANGYSFDWHYVGRLDSAQNVYPPPNSSLPAGSGSGSGSGSGTLPIATGLTPVNGRTPDPPDGYRLPLPSYAQAMVEQLSATAPDMRTQSCPRGIKYVNNPWQDSIVDGLRRMDSRWGYNAKPNRAAGDNGGQPVVAAGDEITYHWGAGSDQGSSQVYSIDILQSHCGTNPSLTWRDFTGEEPVIWTSAGRF